MTRISAYLPSMLCSCLVTILLCAVLGGCAHGTHQGAMPPEAVEATPESDVAGQGAATARPIERPQPRLVVSVIFDQLGSESLLTHLPYLDEDGALRMMAREGAFFPKVRYPHASTLTAPGHALLFTGAPPARSGIAGNNLRSGNGDSVTTSVEDGVHQVVGLPGAQAGPGLLLAPTVAEALRANAAEGLEHRVVSVSLKDRASILSAGKAAGAVLWYEPKLEGMATSTFYGAALPAFATEFQAAHPLSALYAQPWAVPDGEALLARLGPDDRVGEGDYDGYGTVFPHVATDSKAPAKAMRMSPLLSEWLLSLAEAAVEAEGLGDDEVVDLLMISVSGTDYAGHVFGPRSWEYFDHLRRADRALGKLLRTLAERTSLAVLVSSDHGSPVVPEFKGGPVRLRPDTLAKAVEDALDARFGADTWWVAGFTSPYLFLTPAARHYEDQPALREEICRVLLAQRGVAHVVDPLIAQQGRCPCALGKLPQDLRAAVTEALHPERSGDFYVVPDEGRVVDESYVQGAGTQHGTPWAYDRLVPVLVWGAGVAPGCHAQVAGTEQVAPTLSALLQTNPPAEASADPLPVFAAPAATDPAACAAE